MENDYPNKHAAEHTNIKERMNEGIPGRDAEVCREPTFLENQNQRYANNLSRLVDNVTALEHIASKLGIGETTEEKPTAIPTPQNLLGEYEFHNDRFARANDLIQRYLQSLSEAI